MSYHTCNFQTPSIAEQFFHCLIKIADLSCIGDNVALAIKRQSNTGNLDVKDEVCLRGVQSIKDVVEIALIFRSAGELMGNLVRYRLLSWI